MMYYSNGQSACDIGNPAYARSTSQRRKTIKGLCVCRVFRVYEDDYEDVEITYEAEDTGDGYEVYCTRPEVSGASDLLTDVTVALHEDGVQDVARIIWL